MSAPLEPPSRPPSSQQRPPPRGLYLALFHGTWISLALALIVASREVLLPFVLALVVAYVFTPLIARFERLRVPRWAAILLTYAVALGSLGGGGYLMTPPLAREVLRLRAEIPVLGERMRTVWIPGAESKLRELGVDVDLDEEDTPPTPHSPTRPSFLQRAIARAVDYTRHHTMEVVDIGRTVIATISRGIFVFFLTLMLAAYLMLTRERVYGFFRDLCTPHHRPSFDRLMERIDRGLAGVVRGQLLICLVNGVLSAIGFWLFDLKYWFLFSILAGAMSILPIFGSILSSIPVVAIGLTQSVGTAVGVLAWIVGIHQLEANFLNPKIIGDAAKIHPVLVVFSLVVGEHLFKLPGALLAVPVLSMAQSLFLHFKEAIYHEAPASAPLPEAPPLVASPPLTPDPPPDPAEEAPQDQRA